MSDPHLPYQPVPTDLIDGRKYFLRGLYTGLAIHGITCLATLVTHKGDLAIIGVLILLPATFLIGLILLFPSRQSRFVGLGLLLATFLGVVMFGGTCFLANLK